MKDFTANEEALRPYLLGTLDEAAREGVETRLFIDEAFYEELLVAEEELIDQHLAGTLSATDEERFRSFFLAPPERQRKLRFARALRKYVDAATLAESSAEEHSRAASSQEEAGVPRQTERDERDGSSWRKYLPSFIRTRPPVWGFSMATALLVLLLAGSWLAVKNLRSPGGTGGGADLAAQTVPEGARIFALSLTPGAVRGAGAIESFKVPADADFVQLQPRTAAGDYKSYQAVLQTLEGRDIGRAASLTAETKGAVKIVNFNVPARLLQAPEAYQLRLSGLTSGGQLEELETYTFRIKDR